jgi:methylenetetrahydrofolate dehydrogenase (NADP+)/methenyltetrahydrofolate cyclohydrolase
MANIIDGTKVASSIIATVTEGASTLEHHSGIKPGLAVIIVGDDPASHAYVSAKGRMAKQCGFHSIQHSLGAETGQEALERLVTELNLDPNVHGILVQLPLPKHLSPEPVIAAISPDKDVDGLHVINAGKLATGNLQTGLLPCTPTGAMLLVEKVHGRDLSGLNAVVIGRSNLFGKPMALMLLAANATVTMAHSRTRDLPAICRTADILVAAVGQPQMVRGDWIRPGSTIIDVGINRVPAPENGEGKTRLVGDVRFTDAACVAGAVTPVPGGVGPMTIAMLMANTLKAAQRAVG